jgi:hypothetical protein
LVGRSRPACRPISIASKPSRCTGACASYSNGSTTSHFCPPGYLGRRAYHDS